MTSRRLISKRELGQEGLIAIFATLMIMSILGLLTIGFSYATRQAQSRTIDDQLSTQAFYAAESGVNVARAALADPTYSKTTCDGEDIDAALGIRYTCLLVNSTPPSLAFDNVPVAGNGEPIMSEVTLPAGVGSMQISWDSRTAGSNPPSAAHTTSNNVLRPSGTWNNDIGMMRIDLIPLTSFDRATMVANSFTFFTYPTTQPAAGFINVLPGPVNQAGTLPVRCNNGGSYRCVGYVSPSVLYTRYLIRLTAYYNPVRVELQFRQNPGNTGPAMPITGGQAIIDSTGEAGGVFRRIQVRVPITPVVGFHEPAALLTADSICKRVLGSPPDASGAGGSTVIMPPLASPDTACEVFSP